MSITNLTRRQVCIGALALTAPFPAYAMQAKAQRGFDIIRAGKKIGEHHIYLSRGRDGVKTECQTDIAAKLLGVTLYRYALKYTEEYDTSNRLMLLKATSSENGRENSVDVAREGQALFVEGSKYSGLAAGQAVPTSYWLNRAPEKMPWISTNDGALYNLAVTPSTAVEAPEGTARALNVSDNEKMIVDLFYDASGEWIGSAFDARGERAIFKMTNSSGRLNA